MHKVRYFFGAWALLAVTAFARMELMESPAPSRGINIDPVNASFFADLLYFYDSNVDFANANPTDDSGIQTRVGVDLSYGRNAHNLFASSWYMVERHMDETRVDRGQWSVQTRYTFESPRDAALRLDQTYEQIYQNDFRTGRWQDRREFRASALLGNQVTEKTSIVLGGRMFDIAYEHPWLYDWREYSADVDLGHRLTAKSSAIVNFAVAEQSSEGVARDSSSVGASAGFASRLTSKVAYRATAGVESYDSGARDETKLGAIYQLVTDWRVAEKWTATLFGTGNYQPGVDVAGNYARVFTLGTGVTYRPTRRLTTTLQTLYRRDDFGNPVGGRQRTDDQVTQRVDVSFRLNTYATLSMGGEYGFRASTIGLHDYDRYRVHTGLNLRY